MSTGPAAESGPPEVRFRHTVRHLPHTVWIVSVGVLINRAGNFLPVFIVLYLTQRGYSPGVAGLVLGASGLGGILGNAVGGGLADRIGRRATIAVSAVGTAVLTAVTPWVESLVLIVAVVGLIGVASQMYRPAASALLVDAVSTTQQRLAAFAVFRFALNVGAAVGGAVGGVLAATSYTDLFLGNAAAALLCGVVTVVFVRARPAGTGAPEDGTSGGDSEDERATAPVSGFRSALTDRRLVRFLAMTVVAEFVYVQSTVGLPLHVTAIGLSAADYGLLIGLNGVLVLCLELPTTAAVSRRRPEYVLAIGNLLTGLGLAVTGLTQGMVLLTITVLVWTLGEMMYGSVANAYLGDMTPPGLVGRYQGLYGTAFAVGTGIGPLIGGALYAVAPWVLWVVIAVAGLLSAQLCLPTRGARMPSPELRSARVDEKGESA